MRERKYIRKYVAARISRRAITYLLYPLLIPPPPFIPPRPFQLLWYSQLRKTRSNRETRRIRAPPPRRDSSSNFADIPQLSLYKRNKKGPVTPLPPPFLPSFHPLLSPIVDCSYRWALSISLTRFSLTSLPKVSLA